MNSRSSCTATRAAERRLAIKVKSVPLFTMCVCVYVYTLVYLKFEMAFVIIVFPFPLWKMLAFLLFPFSPGWFNKGIIEEQAVGSGYFLWIAVWSCCWWRVIFRRFSLETVLRFIRKCINWRGRCEWFLWLAEVCNKGFIKELSKVSTR